jgi:hypothetical protein
MLRRKCAGSKATGKRLGKVLRAALPGRNLPRRQAGRDANTAKERRYTSSGGNGPFWVVLLSFSCLATLRAQNAPETVGRIEGDDVAVKGQVSLVRENNRNTTVLLSGSEITIRSGTAHPARARR